MRSTEAGGMSRSAANSRASRSAERCSSTSVEARRGPHPAEGGGDERAAGGEEAAVDGHSRDPARRATSSSASLRGRDRAGRGVAGLQPPGLAAEDQRWPAHHPLHARRGGRVSLVRLRNAGSETGEPFEVGPAGGRRGGGREQASRQRQAPGLSAGRVPAAGADRRDGSTGDFAATYYRVVR